MRLMFIISLLINSVYSLNILGIFVYPGKSHFFVFQPYLEELARRGHNVTVISYFPRTEPVSNYVDINLNENYKAVEESLPLEGGYTTLMKSVLVITEAVEENCRSLLKNEKVQHLYKNGSRFDVVVTELFTNECPLGVAHKLGAPTVGLSSTILMPWHYERYGIRDISIIFPLLEGGHKPSLFQRIERMICYFSIVLGYKYLIHGPEQKILSEYLEDVPPLEELRNNMKILLLYQNLLLGNPSPLPPHLIDVGGYHVKKPRPLPHELKKYIEESEHGVIYISFGSMLKTASTPRDKLDAIIGALSELPQRVIWKWEEKSLPGNPKNIMLSKWLPQNDILAHPKVVAFYSHCGLLGTTEAMHHGVPMVGMPVFGDQPANAASMEESGLGVQIHVRDLTKENLLQRFKTVLDPNFRRRVKELSAAWRDRPTSAMDTAIYWTEFVAKHRNVTFRSPSADVPFYQYLYLDVFLIFCCMSIISFFVLRVIFGLICKNKTTKLKSN